MEIAKALILADGERDARPWPTVPPGSKHLFPVANQPILFHNLEALRAAGVRQAAILTGGEAGSAIRLAVGDGSDWGMQVRYEDWGRGRGLGGALAAGREFVGGDPVLVQQGGALLRERMRRHFSKFTRERLDALALRLLNAPGAAASMPTPGYVLSPRAVSILLDGPEAAANPVAGVEAHGGRVCVERVEGCLPCHGDLDALLDSNRRMLERIRPSIDGVLFDECTVQGTVDVHPTAQVERTLMRGPVIIGPGARIVDAYIGPYTSIGAGALIEGTEIEHSIVLPQAQLRHVGTRLESSVIGRGARITRGFQLPGALRMSIGDGAEVVLR